MARAVSMGALPGMLRAGGDAMPTWAWVLIIVLLFLLVFGGFGYSRR